MSFFFDSDSELRSGWKFATYVAVLIVYLIITGLVRSVLFPSSVGTENEFADFLLTVAGQLVAAAAALWFMARFVDRRPIATFGVSLHTGWMRDFVTGIVIAALMLVVVLAGCAILGKIDMRWNSMTAIRAILGTGGVLIGAAAFEELVFRGYPMQVLMKGMGTWPAVLLMSFLFGILHAFNPNASRLGIMNTILAGILLSGAYLKTRSLWFPYGIHLGWNAGLGPVLGFSLSGINLASFWTTTVNAPDALLGGAYGPEGGIVASIAFVAGIGFIRLWKNRNNQEIQ